MDLERRWEMEDEGKAHKPKMFTKIISRFPRHDNNVFFIVLHKFYANERR